MRNVEKLSEKDWEDLISDLFYDPYYPINSSAGTIQSELSFFFSALMSEKGNPVSFWYGLMQTFSKIPARSEFVDHIYSAVCFLQENPNSISQDYLKDMALRGRFRGLKRVKTDEFDMRHLLLNVLILHTYRSDHKLENILEQGRIDKDPYAYYLSLSYYFNINRPKAALQIFNTFLVPNPETLTERRCFANCLYALDENVPLRLNWVTILLGIASNHFLLNLDPANWQFLELQKFIRNRDEKSSMESIVAESQIAFALLLVFATNDTALYNRLSGDMAELEQKYPIILKITTRIFRRSTVNTISIETKNEIEIRKTVRALVNESFNFN